MAAQGSQTTPRGTFMSRHFFKDSVSISSASVAAMSSVSEDSWHELHESDLHSGHDADTEQAGQEQ